MKATSTNISLGSIIGYRVIDPAMRSIGTVCDVHIDRLRRAGEIAVEFSDPKGVVQRVAWPDVVISTEKNTIMVIPSLLK